MRASPSVKRLSPTTSEASARPGPSTVTGVIDDQRAVLADHQAPFRRRRPQAEAEEAERADQHRRIAGAQRELDQQHARRVGQQFAPHHRPGALAAQPRHGDVVARRDVDGRGARHARDARRIDERHDEHDEHRIAGQLGAGRGDGDQRQHQERNADQRLEQPLQDLVDPAADIAGQQPEDRADDEAEQRARQRQQDDDVAAMDDAAEDVAAELVDAERMRPAHARQRHAGAHLREAVGRPERAGDRHDKMDQQDDQRRCGSSAASAATSAQQAGRSGSVARKACSALIVSRSAGAG